MKKILPLLVLLLTGSLLKAQTNTNVGTNAGNAGTNNSTLGYNAGDLVTGQNNTFIGAYSGPAVGTGSYNSFLGSYSGFKTTGGSNSFFGYQAGYNNTTGNSNLFAGTQAGYNSTTGTNSVSLGHFAGYSDNTNGYNVSIGSTARYGASTGSNNVAVGYSSGYMATGNANVFIGINTGSSNTGNSNVFSGESSGFNSGAGANNVYLGSSAGYNATGSSNVFLGKSAGNGETGSNKLYIENSTDLTTPLIYGDFSVNQLSINAKPTGSHALTVGGTVHATGFYVNGQLLTPGTPSQWTTNGSAINYATGNVGIGVAAPNAQLQLSNTLNNRRIVLWEVNNNDHQFYGLGINGGTSTGGTFRFQIPTNSDAYRFFSANDAAGSAELFTIQGNGNVGIGTATPTGKLQVNGRLVVDNVGTGGPMGAGSLLSFSSGGSDVTAIQESSGLNLNGSATAPVKIRNTSLLVGYTSSGTDYGQGNLLAAGNVGIGTMTPHAPLQLGNGYANRKIVLYEEANNDHQYYGLGVTTNTMRFQLPAAGRAYRFFSANDAANSIELFTIQGDGKVGVGTAAPAYPLQVVGKIGATGLLLDVATPAINTASTAQYLHIYNHLSAANGLKTGGVLVADDYGYANPGKNDVIVKGKVAIGTPLSSNPNNYTLAVNGQIGAKDVRVEATSATWPDYVFEETYQLPSLQEVASYLRENKHLKEVPSAKEIAEKGHSLGDMDAVLLKKIEELTLYMIEQSKQVSQQNQQMIEQNQLLLEQNKKLEAQQREILLLKKQLEKK